MSSSFHVLDFCSWISCSCSTLFRWSAWKIFSLIPTITPGPKMHSSTLNTSDGSVIPKLSNHSFQRPHEAKVGENYDIWVFLLYLACAIIALLEGLLIGPSTTGNMLCCTAIIIPGALICTILFSVHSQMDIIVRIEGSVQSLLFRDVIVLCSNIARIYRCSQL